MFGFKHLIRRKIRDLLRAVVSSSGTLSWKDEVRAAKTIKMYVDMLNKEVEI